MELTIHDIIKGPVISDKAYQLNKKLNQLMIRVHVQANKVQIKKALENLFNVKVESVRTATRKHRTDRVMTLRHKSLPPLHKDKIAYITLAEGYSLDMYSQSTVSEQSK